jgi:hypothetical protein
MSSLTSTSAASFETEVPKLIADQGRGLGVARAALGLCLLQAQEQPFDHASLILVHRQVSVASLSFGFRFGFRRLW